MGHLATLDPLYRITVKGITEGEGTSFFGLPLWFAKADGHSAFGSGSAELAILYLVIGVCFFCSGAGAFSMDRLIRKYYLR